MTTPAAPPSYPSQQAHRGSATRHGSGFWLVAALFTVAMAFSTVPTPLWGIYRTDEGLSTALVTVAFAAYAVGVLVSLFLAGHVSDWVGRRRVLLPAMLLEIVSAVLFLTWVDVPGLMTARFLNGLAIGLVTATATAHLAELHAVARPGAGPGRAGVVATAANLGGLGLGSLVAGALAALAPAPLVTSYVVFLVLLVVVTVGLLLVPETVAPPEEQVRYRPQRVAVPRAALARYGGAAVASFAVFMVFGLFTSLAPSFLAEIDLDSPFVSGAAAFAVLGTAALAQVLLGHLEATRQLGLGLLVTALGVAALTAGVLTRNATVFLVGGVVAGGGAGVLFKGAMGTAAMLSAPEQRGEATAGMFLAAYLGLTVPVLGIGAATALGVSLESAVAGFALGAFAVLALAAVLLARGAPDRSGSTAATG